MARVWAILIENGRRNYNNVPERYKADCKAILTADGYKINKDGTVTKK